MYGEGIDCFLDVILEDYYIAIRFEYLKENFENSCMQVRVSGLD